MFFEKKRETEVPPHPRREPRIALPLSLENLKRTFCGCVDFACRDVALATKPGGLPCATSTVW